MENLPSNDPINSEPKEQTCPLCNSEERIKAKENELELLWDKIQNTVDTDEFAAQVMYEKYKQLGGELPPPIPSHIIVDQAVS
jgi:hypothetical protein